MSHGSASPAERLRFDIADIVRTHRGALEAQHPLTREQKRVLTDIANCRTSALGGHLDVCTSCGREHPSYNSCRNRHCPKCQALTQQKWIDARSDRLLDVPHFHVVFTLPSELRDLARFRPRVVFDALFQVTRDTLQSFARTRLQGQIGATLVLHTWTRELTFHPHMHAIVTGGGLSFDQKRWARARRGFLFSVKAMSRVFRAKMMHELSVAFDAGSFAGFDEFDDPQGFDLLMRRIAKLSWNTYSKAPFGDASTVVAYLGRYTHRVGIANGRIVDVTPTTVVFHTRDGILKSLAPVEFLRRFLLHVLPDHFHKIRHVGLYSSPRLDVARKCLSMPPAQPRPAVPWYERLVLVTGRDPFACRSCGAPLHRVQDVSRARAPPSPS